MARLKNNFNWGTVTADLPASGTTATMTSPGLLTVPSVASPDVFPIAIDPNGVHGAPEIVWITAHTASATTATIARAQEGTTVRAHLAANAEEWRHTATAADWADVKFDTTQPVTFTNNVIVKWDEGRYDPRGFTGSSYTQQALNAISAALQDEGGRVRISSPTSSAVHLVDQPLLLPGGVHLDGEGDRRSILRAANDFGYKSGTGESYYLVDYDAANPSGPGYSTTVNKLGLEGPQGGVIPVIGSRNVAMGGLRLNGLAHAQEVRMAYFGVGLQLPQNHNTLRNCEIIQNWIGVEYPDFPVDVGTGTEVYTGGDMHFVGGGATHNKYCSVMCYGSNGIFSVVFENWKFGFGPCGFVREDGHNAAAKAWMSNVSFPGSSIETWGNIVFWDRGTTASGIGSLSCDEVNLRGLNSLPTSTTGFRDPALPIDSAFNLRSVRNLRFETAHLGLSPPVGGKFIWDFTRAGVVTGSVSGHSKPNVTNSISLALASDGLPGYIRGTAAASGWIVDFGEFRCIARYMVTSPLNSGELVKWGNGSLVSRMTASTQFAGVAVTVGNTAGDIVMVAPPGQGNVPVLLGDACVVGNKLYPKSSAEYTASPTVNGDSIGTAQQTGSAGATVLVQTRN